MKMGFLEYSWQFLPDFYISYYFSMEMWSFYAKIYFSFLCTLL